MKIYTRTGDSGETGLFGGGRVPKTHPRVRAYGEIDELNAVLGVAASALDQQAQHEIAGKLRLVQGDLLAIGAHLATPDDGRGRAAEHLPPLPSERIAEMERWIDDAEERLPPLRTFILPGGSAASAHLHVARTVCRRVERSVLALTDGFRVDPGVLIYLNRLSDLLFTFARVANREAGVDETPWVGRR